LSEEVLDIGNLSRVALLALQVRKSNEVLPRAVVLVPPLDVRRRLLKLHLAAIATISTVSTVSAGLTRVALVALQVCKGDKVLPRGLTHVTPLDVGLALAQLDLTPVLTLLTGAAAMRSPEPGASRRDKLLPGFSHDYSSAPALLLADGRGRRPAVF